MKKNKLAIIVPGQGMACSWAGGAMVALAKEHSLKNPDIAMASSGSAGMMSYYVAGQYSAISDILVKFLSTRRFINFFRFWKIIDIDYLIDIVLKKHVPLDEDKVINSKTHYLISATNFETGEIEYLSNKKKDDIFEAMRATKAMPIAFGKRVHIKGNLYCDTILSSLKNLHILKAIEMGATHIIVIDSNNHKWFGKAVFNVWMFFRGEIFKKNYSLLKQKSKEQIDDNNVTLLMVQPEDKLKVNTWKHSKKVLEGAINLGYQECKKHKELKKFLKDFRND
jgi:predicted patatin/cPLA2 family phospholipase